MNQRFVLPLALALLLLAPTARAEDPTTVQLAPFGGLRLGGSLEDADSGDSLDVEESASFGVALEFRYGNENRWWQLWYARQASEIRAPAGTLGLDVEYLHFGGTAPITDEGTVQSYVSAGIGATRLSPGAGLDDATKFSGSIGLGLVMPVSRNVAFRLEARGYLTFLDSDSAIFCASIDGEGGCAIVASGSTMFQAEVTAAIVFGF